MSLHSLHHDIVLLIASHLPIHEYLTLKLSCDSLFLPIPATLSWEAYCLSYSDFNDSIIPYCSPYIQCLDQSQIDLLLLHNNFHVLDILLNRNSLSTLSKQLLFKKSVAFGNIPIFNKLITHPDIDINMENHFAVKSAGYNGHYEILKTLLDHEHLNLQNSHQVLGNACQAGNMDCVLLLLDDDRIDINDHHHFALEMAAYYGQYQIMQLLLQHPLIDFTNSENLAIGYAADNGNFSCLDLLLSDKRLDPTMSDHYCIRYAALNGHTECCRILLLDDRIDPSIRFNSPIRNAVTNGHSACVELLLNDPRVDPFVQNYATIKSCIKKQDTVCLKLLLEDPRFTTVPSELTELASQLNSIECADLLKAKEIELSSAN